MGLIEKGLEAAERRHEKRVRKVVAPSLAPDEEMVAWFHAMSPGETRRKSNAANAAVVGGAGGSLVGVTAVLGTRGEIRIETDTPKLREWVALTRHDRILEIKTNATGGKPKEVVNDASASLFRDLERLDQGYRQGPHFVHFGVVVTKSGRTLVFEIPPYSARPFDNFREKLRAAHASES